MTKWWIYELYILEPRNEGHEEIYEKKIITVKDPTYVVAKKKVEKNSGLRDSHLEITMPVRRSSQSQLKCEQILSHGTDAGCIGSNHCHTWRVLLKNVSA